MICTAYLTSPASLQNEKLYYHQSKLQQELENKNALLKNSNTVCTDAINGSAILSCS